MTQRVKLYLNVSLLARGWRPQVDELSCEPDVLSGANLDAGRTALCSGTYFVTQEDIDSGKVVIIITYQLLLKLLRVKQ